MTGQARLFPLRPSSSLAQKAGGQCHWEGSPHPRWEHQWQSPGPEQGGSLPFCPPRRGWSPGLPGPMAQLTQHRGPTAQRVGCQNRQGMAGENKHGPGPTIRLGWSEQGGLGGHLLGKMEREGRHLRRRACWRWAKSGHIQSQWATGAGVQPIPVRLLPGLGSCPMQLPRQLTAHSRRSVSAAVEPWGMG